jgi:solute carrier family 40 (iron-regulated transporter), member 1
MDGSLLSVWKNRLKGVCSNLTAYFYHRAFVPSFALSLLYLTVLSFNGQMITYLIFTGFNSIHVGVARTVSVVFEISATWIGPIVMSKIGAIRSGTWFLNWQLACISFATLLFWNIDNAMLSAVALAAGTILSRIGLWGFDLSAQIIIQEVCLVLIRLNRSGTDQIFS